MLSMIGSVQVCIALHTLHALPECFAGFSDVGTILLVMAPSLVIIQA